MTGPTADNGVLNGIFIVGFHLPTLSFDELSLSVLGFFFLWDPESELAGLFSTAGVDSALFLNNSLSLSRAGSILATRKQNQQYGEQKSFRNLRNTVLQSKANV